jgi:hypothetical protein
METETNIGVGRIVGGALALLIVGVLGALLFPFLQTLGYVLLVEIPGIWFYGIIGSVATGAAFVRGYGTIGIILGVVTLIMVLIVAPLMGGVYAQEHILANQDFEQQSELPETSQEHVRVLPENVATKYAESANQLPKYETGHPDIAYNNGTYTWAYGVEPDRLLVSWRGNQWGAYYVDMERTNRHVETEQTMMDTGMGMIWFDNYDYQMKLDNPTAYHADDTSFVFQHDGETHIARSYIEHDWKFRFAPIPMPYAVPEYGGTQVVDSDGNIEDMSPEEVKESEMMMGQNTYPYDLARFRMKSMQLQHGLLNKWFVGEDVPAVADTGGFSDNEQPFTVPTKADGPELTYFIAATPGGSGDGIYQIYMIDSQSGEIDYVEFNDTQAGPQKAAGYTRSQNREPTWAADNNDGSTQITEPIPVVIDGTLYWHMRVTPTDGSRVSYTTFVNADSGNVYRADTTEEIYSFIGSESMPDDGGSNESGGQSDGSDQTPNGGEFTVYVVEDGDVVEQFTVTDEQSVEIEAGTPTANATG